MKAVLTPKPGACFLIFQQLATSAPYMYIQHTVKIKVFRIQNKSLQKTPQLFLHTHVLGQFTICGVN